MRRKYILAISILAVGVHFAFPQNASDPYIAEAATVPYVEPIIVEEDADLEETADECLKNGADTVGYYCYSQGKWEK